MVFGRVLLDLFVSSYAVSLVLLFVDAVQHRRIVNRTALVLLFAAFCFETAFLLRQLWSDGLTLVYTTFDVTLLIAWLILLTALVVNAFFRIDIVLFLANLLGFLIVLFASFAFPSQAVYAAPKGDLLALHIVLAVASYAAFAFSFIFASMYLLQKRLLRNKTWTRWFFRLPALERLDTYSTRAVVIGVPLLLVSIALGAVWGNMTLESAFIVDPKVWATGIILALYGLFLVFHLRTGWATSKLIWLNIACFIALVLNFVILNHFSAVHLRAL